MKILICAHLDDEMLWFNPDQFDKIIIVFLGRNDDHDFNYRRQKALLSHPLRDKIVCLNYQESGIANRDDILDNRIKATAFLENWKKLELDLAKYIIPASEIYTHNQWGEYGHPEHVMINAVVNTLAANRSVYCLGNLVGEPRNFSFAREEKSDIELFYRLRDFYQENNIWTFRLDYRPPDIRKYYQEDQEEFKKRQTKIII